MNQTHSEQQDEFFRNSEIFAAGAIDAKRLLASMGISYAADGSIAFDEPVWRTVHPNGKGVNSNGENIKGQPVLLESTTGEILGVM